ncbi:MAG: hypothetical protein ACYDCI_11425 [Candidatus Limnocylindrales bacterium]
MRYLRAFGAFWYDFLVGDRPELFVGSIVVLALVWLAIQAGLDAGLAGLVLTVAILIVGGLGVLTASRPRR